MTRTGRAARAVAFHDLGDADLIIGSVYRGGDAGNYGDDPISKLIGGGNQGGIRFEGSFHTPHFIVLYSTFADEDWPDHFSHSGRRLIYFGDNKKPGAGLHETPKHGNEALREAFHALHGGDRDAVPPVFLFGKANHGRDVIFEGMCVPSAFDLGEAEDLVAFWTSSEHGRFLNYRATFTMLMDEIVTRGFVDSLRTGAADPTIGPDGWRAWRERGFGAIDVATPICRPWRSRGVGGDG